MRWTRVAGMALSILPVTLGLPGGAIPGPPPRIFDLNLTREKRAPNGFSREMILVNGQSPGPLLEVNEGDEVWVTVHNHMLDNTTMHFHGIEMENTPWSDGVPGVTQREILPGGSFQYKWTATQYGEYWYHAHHRGQLDDGDFGPLIIHPKKGRQTPFSLISQDKKTLAAIEKAVANIQPVMLSDHRNIPAPEAWDLEVAANMELPCYDSMLVNGKGKIDCWSAEKIASLTTPQQKQLLGLVNMTSLTPKGCLPKEVDAFVLAAGRQVNLSAIPAEIYDECTPTEGSRAVIEVKSYGCDKQGTWAALEIVGAYSLYSTAFSIDELPMWIYAVDGEYIQPQRVTAIRVSNGDRYSVLVNIAEPGDYTIRHASTMPVQLISGQATLSYRDSKKPVNQTGDSKPYISDAGLPLSSDVVFFNQTAQKSLLPFPVAQKADQTFVLGMGNTETAYMWALNGTSQPMTLDAEDPILFKPQPNLMNNLTITTLNDTWIDLVFVTTQVPEPSHPIHKHGNKMWLLGSGSGPFKWSSVDEAIKAVPQNFNLVDPPRRDGFATLDAPRAPTWTVVRYHVTNPGAWFLHCHIQTHLLGGMSMVIQDGVDHWPKVPADYLAYGA